jgi:hypothetical protein
LSLGPSRRLTDGSDRILNGSDRDQGRGAPHGGVQATKKRPLDTPSDASPALLKTTWRSARFLMDRMDDRTAALIAISANLIGVRAGAKQIGRA